METTNENAANGGKDFQSDENANNEPQGKMVPAAELEKVLKQVHELKARTRQFEQERKTLEEQKLEETKEYQKLYEAKKKELEEINNKYSNERKAYVRAEKFRELKAHAEKAGLRKEALDDLDLLDYDDKLQIEYTNTGKHSVIGVESYVEDIKAKKPHWFGSQNKPFNTATGDVVNGSNNGVLSMPEIIALEKKAKQTKDPKDMQAYEQAFKNYLQRR